MGFILKNKISVGLCEGDLKNMCSRYHFEDTGLSLLQTTYRECFAERMVTVYCREVPYSGENRRRDWEIPCDGGENHCGGGAEEKLAVLMTLGQQTDEMQAGYMKQGKLSEAYAMDCIAAELLYRAYEEADRLIFEKTGMWCGRYRFPGSDIPMEVNREIVEAMGAAEVVCNDAFVLIPKKSVAYLTYMQKEKPETGRRNTMCADCGRKDCPNQRTEKSAAELNYGYRRIFGNHVPGRPEGKGTGTIWKRD